ncbi:MAG: MBL fold metallo-hydrolase [Deltaproteobacteria bacterium]|nr:MBL fold metallo-hydrolase [Deltaproteobacteria bacterium]
MSIRLRWLGYVCFEIIRPSGKVLVIDPYIDYSPTAPIKCQEVTGADYIALTHGHYDHVTDVGPLAEKYDSKVICSSQVAEPLANFFKLDPARMIKVTAGNTIDFEDLSIEVKKAEHISLLPVFQAAYKRITGEDADPKLSLAELNKAVARASAGRGQSTPADEMRQKMQEAGIVGGEQLNFIFTTSDNLRIYVYSADAIEYLRKEVRESRANIFCPQLGGVSAHAAADMAALSGAEIVIPTHHDGEGIETMHARAQKMAGYLKEKSNARLLDIEHGKWYELGVTVTEAA